MAIDGISGNSSDSYNGIASAASSQAAAQQVSDNSFEKLLQQAVDNRDEKELKEACKQFEGIMLNMMYKSMKATIIKSDLVEEDAGTELFQSMLDEELVDEASQTGTLGLADALYKQLSRQFPTSYETREVKEAAGSSEADGTEKAEGVGGTTGTAGMEGGAAEAE